MNLNAYLERIGYTGDTAPMADNLRAIHRAHMFSVPFENLDIHLGRPILLELPAIYAKIVEQRRGGFCYEQNGLFAHMLTAMGYRVSMFEARVIGDDGALGIPFDHLALMVDLEERWLADVGFGDSFVEPLRLDVPAPQLRNRRHYRVHHDGRFGTMAVKRADGWHDDFRFEMQPRQLGAFAPGCNYHQTSPDSSFTQRRVCSLATPQGRVTLAGLKLIETVNDVRTETQLPDEAAVQSTLKAVFGIHL